ncbi:Hachiman antiphage defense system protein HamA [Lacrimispora celerecrescens]|uniref:HamA C-terminal domain-containing protein n=1 Tax=Lacrimispora celerecrescens TaxID=29354 RepID=UPI0016469352|nr:Hachiman antiphage defense system protein HamA [Lacrimispora celerecrescens]
MIDEAKKAVAKLTCGVQEGTAFLVTKDTALTATHCILESIQEEKEILLYFYNLGTEEPYIVKANYVEDKEGFPIAVLKLQETVDVATVGVSCYLDHIERGSELLSYGYPKVYSSEGYPINLSVNQYMNSNNSYDYDIAVLIDVKSRVKDYSGMSGSPVYFRNQIIGVLHEEGIEGSTNGYHAIDLKVISNEKIQSLFKVNQIPYMELYFQGFDEEQKSCSPFFSPLPSTLKNRDFKNVFEEVSHGVIGLSNPEDMKIFRFKTEDYNFTYMALKKFLNTNIGRYMYSRAKMNQYQISDDMESIGMEAAQFLRKNRTGGELGEMLLYSFLEEVLQAPKLFSKVELRNLTGKCDGIHIHTLTGATPIYQMVFGTSNIQGDLTSAIDKVFDTVIKIKNEKPDEMMLVESTAFNCAFTDNKTAEQIKEILLPSKKDQDFPATAYGLFIGYSLDMDESDYDLSLFDFKNKMAKRMQADIVTQASYIASKIKALRLGIYSFYIYIIPFNDADKDKNEIIDILIGGATT